MRLPTLKQTYRASLVAGVLTFGFALASGSFAAAEEADSLLIVDCLLPGRIQQLGAAATYMSARRAIKTSAADCRVRGGEYTKSGETTYASMMRIWLPLANGGDAEAQTNLGEIFEKGVGGPPQPDLALQWYKLAAEKGNARAQVDLGSMYERGVGVPRDPGKAMEWYRRATGLQGTNLFPAPAEEVSHLRDERDALARQLEAERRRREQLELELNSVRQKLGSERSSLQDRQLQLDNARRELAVRTQAFEDQRRRIESAPTNDEERRMASERLSGLQRQLDEQRRAVAERDAQLHDLQASVQQLESRSGTLQSQLAEAERQRSAARSDARLAQQNLADVTERLRQANEELNGRLAAVGENRAAVEKLKHQLSEQQNNSASQISQRLALESQLQQREAELAENRRQLASLNAEIARLERENTSAGSTRGATAQAHTAPMLPKGVDFGRYHALIIGNNNFRFVPKLRTAVGDAQAVESLLRRRYGFRTTLILDANRYQLLSALNVLREKLTSQDNLLIYYAGHGELDRTNSRGYWLPVDAEANSTANWIPSYEITDILNAMAAKQIMLVADSCYSGMLTRSAVTRLKSGMTDDERMRWYQAMTTKHARVALTSGGIQPVSDSGGGKHSVFAAALIGTLDENQEVLEGQRLAQEVTQRVAVSVKAADIEQVPMYAPLGFAGHEAGDFIFVPVQ